MRDRHYWTVLKTVFIVVIITVLIRQDLLSLEPILIAFSRWPWILTGWAFMLFSTLTTIVRWHFLIRAQGIQIPVKRTFQAAFVGLFFNMFLPGSLSGDLVKGYYIVRAAPGHTAATVSSVLFDRIVGMSGLIALAAIVLIAGRGGEWAGMLGTPVIIAVLGIAIGVSVFYIALLGVDEQRDPILKIAGTPSGRLSFLRGALSVYRGIRVYHDKKAITLTAIVGSVVAHASFAVGWICYMKAMGIDGIPTAALFVVVPVGMLVAAIPLAPGGIGTGHAAFLAIFAMLGSNRGADLFNLVLVFQFIQAGIGGIVYLFIKTSDPAEPGRPVLDQMETLMSADSTVKEDRDFR